MTKDEIIKEYRVNLILCDAAADMEALRLSQADEAAREKRTLLRRVAACREFYEAMFDERMPEETKGGEDGV